MSEYEVDSRGYVWKGTLRPAIARIDPHPEWGELPYRAFLEKAKLAIEMDADKCWCCRFRKWWSRQILDHKVTLLFMLVALILCVVEIIFR
jgi:hypothetical protein